MTALKEELINCIQDIPDERLLAVKPLLYMLSKDSIVLGKVSFEDLAEDEKAAIIQGCKEYESGECIDFEDYFRERGIEINR